MRSSGGIVPMAVLSGYGTREESGGTGFVSRVDTRDYRLDAIGAAWSWRIRVELSAARQLLLALLAPMHSDIVYH